MLDLTFSVDADEEKLILYEKNEVPSVLYSSGLFRFLLNLFLIVRSAPVIDMVSSNNLQVTDYELIPGGRNIRVTEENKHEYVDRIAEHRLTTAIRPQINAFLEGFNELIQKDLISIFNDKELELLISGLPDIDCKSYCSLGTLLEVYTVKLTSTLIHIFSLFSL